MEPPMLILLTVTFSSCLTLAVDPFSAPIDKGVIFDGRIDEASGLAVSRAHDDLLYTHNDKGGSSRIFAVKISTGMTVGTFNIRGRGVYNYDWEDLALGPCVDDCMQGGCSALKPPSRYCVYIADTGDHGGDGAHDIVYMLREPSTVTGGTLDVVMRLTFTWTEPDAETLMIDPTGQMYVVSKVKNRYSKIIQLPMNGWRMDNDTSAPVMNIDMSKAEDVQWSSSKNNPQGGDISPQGTEMVMVAEDGIWYWSMPDGDVMKAARTTVPAQLLNYVRVDATEAIAWTPQGTGFYTLAEGVKQTIKFYAKMPGVGVGK